MAAFFKAFAPPGRLVLVRPLEPTFATANLVCVWRRDSEGRLVRRWAREDEESCSPAALAWAA